MRLDSRLDRINESFSVRPSPPMTHSKTAARVTATRLAPDSFVCRGTVELSLDLQDALVCIGGAIGLLVAALRERERVIGDLAL